MELVFAWALLGASVVGGFVSLATLVVLELQQRKEAGGEP